MIDLAAPKHTPTLGSPEVASNEAAPDYPSLRIHTDKPIKFPSGAFHAKVKMRAKGGEWNTDSHGKKTYTHHMEMMAMHPKMEAENAKEDAAAAEEPDAAEAIMQAMRGARQKKITQAE